MVRKKISQPTEKEVEILSILWRHGPSTVRQVNKEMSKRERTGYTTTLKLMQIMHEKGLVKRDNSSYKHIYTPIASEEKTQKQLIGNLVDRAFSGSAEKLVMRLLSAKNVSPEELANIRRVIEEMEGK